MDIAIDDSLAQSGGEVKFHFTQDSHIFAYDLNAAGALGSRFIFVGDGRDTCRSIIIFVLIFFVLIFVSIFGVLGLAVCGCSFLHDTWIATAHKVSAFAAYGFDVDICFWLRLDKF